MPELQPARRGALVACIWVFLCSDASASVNGVVLPVDRGNHLGGM